MSIGPAIRRVVLRAQRTVERPSRREMRMPSPRRVLALVALLVLPLLPGCGGEEAIDEETAAALPQASPILFYGPDGFEWDLMLPMLKEGKLPNYAALMERGCYGELETITPALSPAIWTTIGTGKMPEAHGIPQFTHRLPDGSLSPFHSNDRKTKALWNILSDYDKTLTCIGWWMTQPVEPVNGIMVAQTNTSDQLDIRGGRNIWKGSLREDIPQQVYPPERQEEMFEILRQTQDDLPRLMEEIFGTFEHPLSELGNRLWTNCKWAFRGDTTYLRIAMKLAEEGWMPDVTLLYVGGPDVICHRFWRYMQPELFAHRPTPEQIENFGDVIEDYYIYTDQALGRLLEVYGEDVNIIIISDHGFHATNVYNRFDPDDPPDDVNSGHHLDGPPGIFIAAGPCFRESRIDKPLAELERRDLPVIGSVEDITPTILAMQRIPLGADMTGEVMTDIFRDEFHIDRQPRMMATHDTEEFFANQQRETPIVPGDQERLDQLRSLGYIGGEEEDEEDSGE
ncbi:MAG: alkaline phosphatase family protein [Planctomycetota bacterium]|nr:alkaline phosphatase family protein [Planctomycetota bacterium]